nr:PREDICTED: COMM domain-containing protein 8 [Apteryx mantelli mantelli]
MGCINIRLTEGGIPTSFLIGCSFEEVSGSARELSAARRFGQSSALCRGKAVACAELPGAVGEALITGALQPVRRSAPSGAQRRVITAGREIGHAEDSWCCRPRGRPELARRRADPELSRAACALHPRSPAASESIELLCAVAACCWKARYIAHRNKNKPKLNLNHIVISVAKFLHKIVDGICGRAYPRYQDYGGIWNLMEWMEVLEETMTYLKTTVGKNISDEEAAEQMNALNSNYQEAITKCLKGRKEEIRNALVERVNAISSAQLQDFDWQLKLALSSDKISMLQMPLLNLDLDVRENGEIKPISIEMNKEELQNLINALEAANKVVLQLK